LLIVKFLHKKFNNKFGANGEKDSGVIMDYRDFVEMYEQGKHQEFYDKLDEIEKSGEINTFTSEERLKIEISMINVLNYQNYKETELHRLIKERLEVLKRNIEKDQTLQFGLLEAVINYFIFRQKNSKEKCLAVMNTFEEYINHLDEIPAFWGRYYYYVRSLYYYRESRWDLSLQSLNQSLQYAEQMKDSYLMSLVRIRMQFAYAELTDLTKAIASLNKGLEIANKNNFLWLQYLGNFNLCFQALMLGEYNKGLESALEALNKLETYEKLNPNHHKGMKSGILNNLGIAYRTIGELGKAEKYLLESLEKNLADSDYPPEFGAETLSELGEVYRLQGDLPEARKFLEEGLERWGARTRERHDFYIPTTLFSLIRLYFDLQETEKIRFYVEQLKKLKTETENEATRMKCNQIISLTNALLLKNSPRITEKAEANKILTELINDEVVVYDITALAMIHLAELLIEEYKGFQEPEVLQEAQDIITKLYELGKRNNVHPITINALILRSKFLLIENEIDQAISDLEQAKELAEGKKLERLLDKVTKEIETTQNSFTKTPMINLSIQERIERLKLETYMKEAEKVMEIRKKL
jgi:hypothetical protein